MKKLIHSKPKTLIKCKALLAEGPVWNHRTKEFSFVDSFDNLELTGLMFMPNINQNKVSHIKEIRDSVALFNDMKSKKRNIQVLSLGTSSDYKECIKAGSNLIRVGEILFGPRL